MDIDQISDEDRAELYRDDHPKCECGCGNRCCYFEDDGSIRDNHFDCDDDMNADEITDDGKHVGYVRRACMSHYLTTLIRDCIQDGLNVRRGAELNQLIIADRSNNIAIQVYELFRSLGIVEPTKKGR